MDQDFSLKNQNIEKNTGKVREFCEAGKVGTMILPKIQIDLNVNNLF